MYKTKDPARAKIYQDMAKKSNHSRLGSLDLKNGDSMRNIKSPSSRPNSTKSINSAFMTFAQRGSTD